MTLNEADRIALSLAWLRLARIAAGDPITAQEANESALALLRFLGWGPAGYPVNEKGLA